MTTSAIGMCAARTSRRNPFAVPVPGCPYRLQVSARAGHIPTRDAQGRAASAYRSPQAIMVLLRDVALIAEPLYPADVSMRTWNRARASSGHPDAPSAESLHQRFNRDAARKVTWRRLLEGACAGGASAAQTAALPTRQAIAKHADERHVAYGLGLVAAQLDRSFPPGEYDAVCERLIARERRRLGSDSPLGDLLPSATQIERITGGWAAALALVGLPAFEARVQTVFRKRNSMPVAEAVALFVELNGRYPSHPVLAAWARDADISLAQSQRTSTWWREALDAAEVLLTDRGTAIPASRPTAPEFHSL